LETSDFFTHTPPSSLAFVSVCHLPTHHWEEKDFFSIVKEKNRERVFSFFPQDIFCEEENVLEKYKLLERVCAQ